MKIESSNYINMLEKYRKSSEKTNNEIKPDNVDKVKVEISSDYNIYDKAIKELKKMDKCESNHKLNAIASKMKNGNYEIDILKIAKSIIDKCER